MRWLPLLAILLLPMTSAQAQACPQTLQAMVNAAQPGATILVPNCVFHETVTVNKPLTLDGQNKAIIDGDGTRIRWVWIAASNVTIKNFTMRNAATQSQQGAIGTQAGISNITIDHNDLSGTKNGANIGIGGTRDSRVTNNQLHHGGATGMTSYQNTNLTISGNNVYSNNTAGTDWGFEAGGMKLVQDNGLVVQGNEVHHNAGFGIWNDIGATNVLIADNFVHDQAYNPIFYEISSNAEITRNTVQASRGPQVWGSIVLSSAANVNVHDNTIIDSTFLRAQLDNRADAPPGAGTGNRLVNNRLLRPDPNQATSWWQYSPSGPLVPGQNGNVDQGNQIVTTLTPTPVPTSTPVPIMCEMKVRLNGVEGPWKPCQ